MRHVIRRIRTAHCKRGPSRCEKCRETEGDAICLLDIDPPDRGMVQRRVMEFRTGGLVEWREFDVVKLFASEAEARAYAAENGIEDLDLD